MINLEGPIASGARFIHIRTGSTCSVVRSNEDMVVVKWEDTGKETDYGIDYFDQIFNPLVNTNE